MASKEWNAEQRSRKSRVVDQYAGNSCLFCGYVDRLVAHRKDGQAHKRFECMGENEHRAEFVSGKYIRLCFRCHKSVHWCMEYLGLGWEEIIDLWGRGANENTSVLHSEVEGLIPSVSTIN